MESREAPIPRKSHPYPKCSLTFEVPKPPSEASAPLRRPGRAPRRTLTPPPPPPPAGPRLRGRLLSLPAAREGGRDVGCQALGKPPLESPPLQMDKEKGNRAGARGGRRRRTELSTLPDCTCAPPRCPLRCKLSGRRWLLGSLPGREERPPVPPSRPASSPAPPGSPRARGAPREAEGPRARPPRPRAPRGPGAPRLPPGAPGRGQDAALPGARGAALTPTGPGSSSRWPRTSGREAACRAAGAPPWRLGAGRRRRGRGPRRRVLGRRRSCAASGRGARAAGSPLRAQGRSPRSLQSQRERASQRAAGAPRPAQRGPGRAAWPPTGGCSCRRRRSGLNLPSRSRRQRRPVRPAPPRRPREVRAARSPEPRAPSLPPGARSSPPRAGGEGEEGAAAGGGRRSRPSPWAPPFFSPPLSREGLFSLSFPLSLVSFPFPDHDSNTIEGNHI